MIQLKRITWDNFNDVMKLKVKDDQSEFVAPIAYSLAQAYVGKTSNNLPPICLVIYDNEILIGHVLINHYNKEKNIYGEDDCYVINRFFIDERFQGKGHGKKAFAYIIEYIKTYPLGQVDSVYLSYNQKNQVARNLYYQFGFEDTNRLMENKEVIARLKLNS